jgi:hypothetical protein
MKDRKYTDDFGWKICLEQRPPEHQKLNERIVLKLSPGKQEDKTEIKRAGE